MFENIISSVNALNKLKFRMIFDHTVSEPLITLSMYYLWCNLIFFSVLFLISVVQFNINVVVLYKKIVNYLYIQDLIFINMLQLYKYSNLIAKETPYAKKMKALSNQIFGEVVRPTDRRSMRVSL